MEKRESVLGCLSARCSSLLHTQSWGPLEDPRSQTQAAENSTSPNGWTKAIWLQNMVSLSAIGLFANLGTSTPNYQSVPVLRVILTLIFNVLWQPGWTWACPADSTSWCTREDAADV